MSFGRLERTQGPQPMSEINMTPLIDVMLVLLVIFIITAPLLVNAVKVELPRTDTAKAAQVARFLAITLDAQGQVFVNDQLRSPDGLLAALNDASRANPDTEVQLRADATVPYGRVVALMGVVQKAGLNRIAFVAEPPKP